MFEEREKSPDVLGAANIAFSAVLHVLFFLLCWLVVKSPGRRETVIPIDLTVVVHENLDGNEDEPPPQEKPKPEPPPPEQKPKPPAPPPQEKVPDAVVKVPDKKPEKKKEPEKPKESREDRMKRMRESATVVKPKEPPPPPRNNGKTAKKTLSDAEIAKLLNQGYKPGASEQLAANEEQLCLSLIYRAFYEKWDSPPYSASLKDMILCVRFDAGGGVAGWELKQGSGDAAADASVRRAAQRVKYVPGLTPAFLRKNKEVNVRFKVRPQ